MPTPISQNPYGDDVYATPNGNLTGTQIMQQLQAAGWQGAGDPVSVYNQTAGAAANTSSTPSNPAGPVGANVDVAKEAWNQGQQQALQAYYNSKLAGESEDRAFRRAQQAWLETMDRASMTGMFEGAPTLPSMMGYGEMFGQWGMPQQGQQTLAAQKQQQDTALGYLGLLGQMRGPQNYFQYQNVLGATPGGMKDLVAAAMGQYIPGGGATTGVQPMAQSLQGMQADVTGQGYGQPQAGTMAPVAPGVQPAQYNPQQMQAAGLGYGQARSPTAAASGYGSQIYNQQQSALASQLPAPNQIAPQAWANMAPSQRQLLMSGYESQGWNAEDVKGLFNQSLPKYGSTNPGAGAFKLV